MKKAVKGTRSRKRQLRTQSKGVVRIPLFGTIPAGFPQEASPEPKGVIEVDFKELGFKPTMRTFALRVCGDEMSGRHILDGDVVILEHGLKPRDGDVVAALINNKSVVRTFVVVNGKPFLKAEGPKHPNLIPAGDLVIQGVMLTLVRKSRASA